MIDGLEPFANVPVEQEFIVSEEVLAYSSGQLILQLMLSDPHTSEMPSTMAYNMDIQILGLYYNPVSRFLLVVNSNNPSYMPYIRSSALTRTAYIYASIFTTLVLPALSPTPKHKRLS